jgi:stringent starvation protein B
MTPNRPYLIRALNEWILDNELTPHILVDAEKDGVFVPEQFVEGGKIVLNISPIAVKSLQITNESITFSARFSGNSYNIFVPINTILAIYSKENRMGMIFPDELDDAESTKSTETKNIKPHLTVIK